MPKFSQPERAKYEWHPRGVQHKTTLFPDFFSATFPNNKQSKTDQLDAAFFFEFQLPTTSHRFLTQFFRIHLSFTNNRCVIHYFGENYSLGKLRDIHILNIYFSSNVYIYETWLWTNFTIMGYQKSYFKGSQKHFFNGQADRKGGPDHKHLWKFWAF